MKKRLLIIFLVLLLVIPIALAEDRRYIFVPKGDMERAFLESERGFFTRDPGENPRFVDQLNRNGLTQDFNEFLDEKNVPFGFNTFQRMYDSDEESDRLAAVNLAFEFSSRVQIEVAEESRENATFEEIERENPENYRKYVVELAEAIINYGFRF